MSNSHTRFENKQTTKAKRLRHNTTTLVVRTHTHTTTTANATANANAPHWQVGQKKTCGPNDVIWAGNSA